MDEKQTAETQRAEAIARCVVQLGQLQSTAGAAVRLGQLYDQAYQAGRDDEALNWQSDEDIH